MNIDLRNVSERFEENVNEIKKLKKIKNNTKVVEICVLNYLKLEKQKEDLEQETYRLKAELRSIKGKINLFKEFISFVEEIK